MNSMNSFTCFSLSPIGIAHPGIAVATTRAGGVGLLDREFWSGGDDVAIANLDRLLELVKDTSSVGLRLRLDQIAESRGLLERLGDRPHWLILCGWEQQLLSRIALLPQSRSRRLLLEVTDVNSVLLDDRIDGLVAKGHESGGWVGEDSAFILTQKLLNIQPKPVYVQGGIGIHTVAACRAAGAAGVILDDQLLLMPESPIPDEWQPYLNQLNGTEAIAIGEKLNASCRVLSRPGFEVISRLQKLAEQIEVEHEASQAGTQQWKQQAKSLIGWDTPGVLAYPIGQAVGLAASYRDRYKTTGRLVQALLKASQSQIESAKTLRPLQPNAPLAVAHRTRYPIVQGPMTRVSDTAEFADAVSRAGALPMLALALLRGAQVRDLLYKTKELIGDKSWGIGILGFVPTELRAEQMQAVLEVKPPFALIAGGRPDQAAQLEAQGIASYIHVPTPGLLKMFLEAGAKRFVFEGRECGGHVGPLSSFMLWESAISTLLDQVPAKAADIHVLFAGGIHDARSAAMVSAMAAPLVERGMRIGVLMGTAYLFTKEAVDCGAIVDSFQKQAITCNSTINLETGPGHASRCVRTQFADEFYATRRRMLAAGNSAHEIKNVLEELNLGRLRVASKGLVRGADNQITAIDPEKQLTDGMYMIGQVATIRDKVCSIHSLHQDVSEKSSDLLEGIRNDLSLDAASTPNPQPLASSPSDIAIIGIGTLLPKATEPEIFWQNILASVNTITEIPPQRWDWRLYYDPDRNAKDKVYSKWGGFLDDVPFDPIRFGIPPKSLKSIEPLQLLTLEVVRRALADAGYESGNFDRENTSVILGAGGGVGDLGEQYATRSQIPRILDAPSAQVWERLPQWSEETFPGLLSNVLAGRVANRFDFGGSNFTVDAACASSLAAIDLAVRELESGRSNIAIAGGVDVGQSPFAYLCFSKTQAFSAQGKVRTFDKAADGIIISEGLAVVVLKRLEDAERDGDRIYGVIKAVASSSDGKALGLTAPLPAGQMRAFDRAYKKAGISPNTLGLYEAHGTGTVAGDRAELETIVKTLKANNSASKSCAIGSIKTTLGHTKSTAGAAALVKAVLSLHHKVLPPHSGVDNPLDAIADPESSVYLLKQARPWFAHPDYPRRCGVSAFGFGGTNFHAIVEEYRGEFKGEVLGADNWSCELVVLRSSNHEALAKDVNSLKQALDNGAEPRLPNLAYSYAKQANSSSNPHVCLSIVVESLQQLREALDSVLAHLKDRVALPPHIQLSTELISNSSPIAFLFPGQGSQYPNMACEVALYFKEMRKALEAADRQLGLPKLLSQFIYPPSAYSKADETRNSQQLTDTQIAQPAIGVVEAGYMDLLARLGLFADMVGGNSYGEYAALHNAGVLSRKDFFSISQTRGRVMSAACGEVEGAMAAVQATREELQAHLDGLENVVIANHNAPLQSVISGNKQAVQQVVDSLNSQGIVARMLPVAGAFHCAMLASAQKPLADAIAAVKMYSPKIPVYSNSSARPYDCDIDQIRTQLSQHLLSPVEFVEQIKCMYSDGARIFVEVGPKSTLTKLVDQILAGKEHTAVSLDGQGGGLRGLLLALGTMITRGVNIRLTALFEGRNVRQLDLSRLVQNTRKPELPRTAWLVNGGSARPQEKEGESGRGKEEEKFSSKIQNPKSKIQNPPAPSPQPLAPHNSRTNGFTSDLHQQTGNSLKPAPTSTGGLTKDLHQQTGNSIEPAPTNVRRSQTPATPAMTYQPTQPQVLSNNHTSSPEVALVAYQAYQETMRQFLALQEQVMMQFLNVTSSRQIIPPPPTITAIAATTAPQISPDNGKRNGNGNGAVMPAVQPPTPPAIPPSPSIPTPQLEIGSGESGRVGEWENGSNSPRTVVTSSAPSAPQGDRATLTQTLLELVSDRTGYPIEMLGLDQDMEAELGIDSIKRVEILGAVVKSLPQNLSASVQEQMDSFTQAKTLNGIVAELLQVINKEAPPASPAFSTQEDISLGKSPLGRSPAT